MERDEIAYQLGELQGTMKSIHESIMSLKNWIMAHETADKVEHAKIYSKIGSMLKYGTSISIVSFIIGFFWGK